MLKKLWEVIKILTGIIALILIGAVVILMFHISGFIFMCLVVGVITVICVKG